MRRSRHAKGWGKNERSISPAAAREGGSIKVIVAIGLTFHHLATPSHPAAAGLRLRDVYKAGPYSGPAWLLASALRCTDEETEAQHGECHPRSHSQVSLS